MHLYMAMFINQHFVWFHRALNLPTMACTKAEAWARKGGHRWQPRHVSKWVC